MELLLYMGADQEVHDRFSRLPLHVAAANSHCLVQVLLDMGGCVNAQDNAGRSVYTCHAHGRLCHTQDNAGRPGYIGHAVTFMIH